MRYAERLVASEPQPRTRWAPPTWLLVVCGCLALPGCWMERGFASRATGDVSAIPTVVALALATGLSGWIAVASFAGRQRGFGERSALAALAGTVSFVGLFASVFLLGCALMGSIGTHDTRITAVLYDFVLQSLLATAPLALVQQLLLSMRYPEPQSWRLSLLVLLAWGTGAMNFWTLFWFTT